MDILYLLIPLSAVLVLGIVAIFGWAIHSGQFDDIDREAERLLDDAPAVPPSPADPASGEAPAAAPPTSR